MLRSTVSPCGCDFCRHMQINSRTYYIFSFTIGVYFVVLNAPFYFKSNILYVYTCFNCQALFISWWLQQRRYVVASVGLLVCYHRPDLILEAVCLRVEKFGCSWALEFGFSFLNFAGMFCSFALELTAAVKSPVMGIYCGGKIHCGKSQYGIITWMIRFDTGLHCECFFTAVLFEIGRGDEDV